MRSRAELLVTVTLTVVVATPTAAETARPVVIYSRPAVCPPEKLIRCEAFDDAVAHPAMQRRLASVVFETVPGPDDQEPFLAVRDPSGVEVVRWTGWLDWTVLSAVLARIDEVGPRVLEAHRALLANEPFVVERQWALAVLTFGDEVRGRTLLETMLVSESLENRQLAEIWLERLNSRQSPAAACEEMFTRLAREGLTTRVRFEAWMALGDLRRAQDRARDAIDAYDRAVETAPDGPTSRRNALAARQRASAIPPVLGLDPPGSVIAGRRSVQLRVVPKKASRVEYRVDGRLVATSRETPFVVSISFGRIPSRQVLEVITRDRAGRVLDRSSLVVNERSDAFAVELVEPSGDQISGTVDVVASARVPRGRSIEELVIEWNGVPAARFTAPPYRTQIHVREQGLLRAVLRLDDGSETEAVRLANRATTYDAGAHLVEVPAYFDGLRPRPQEVLVREAGQPRTVEQVIPPSDAPLMIALLIDSSGSMNKYILDVQEAAVRFIEEQIEPRDRVMLVAFNSVARVLVRPTSDRAAVAKSILALQPGGPTALHDALIMALLQLQSAGSRKALVVFSDGFDVSSNFTSGDVAEVARRSGVPIYVLAFTPDRAGIPPSFSTVSASTGGKAFEMRSLRGLATVWDDIAADLRRQSLIIYRTKTAGAEWRPLEVTLRGRGRVRAPTGVYVTAFAAN